MLSITREQFEQVCGITATSNKSLVNTCKEVGCSYGSMRKFIDLTDETRSEYARAKEAQADFLAEEILEISDDSSGDEEFIETEYGTIRKENREFTSRSKLRVDARKWVAAHLRPKKYSDHIDVTSNGETVSVAGSLSEARKRAAIANDTNADDLL